MIAPVLKHNGKLIHDHIFDVFRKYDIPFLKLFLP